MREKRVEKRLTDGAKKRGGMALKWVSPGRRGVPDRIVILPPGRIYLVELKNETGTLSDIQDEFHRRLRTIGVCPFVLGSPMAVDLFYKAVDEGDI